MKQLIILTLLLCITWKKYKYVLIPYYKIPLQNKKISRGARLMSPGRHCVEYLKHLFYSLELYTFERNLLARLGSSRLVGPGIKIRLQQFLFHGFPLGILLFAERFLQLLVALLSRFRQVLGYLFGVGTVVTPIHFSRRHGRPTASHTFKTATSVRSAAFHTMALGRHFP